MGEQRAVNLLLVLLVTVVQQRAASLVVLISLTVSSLQKEVRALAYQKNVLPRMTVSHLRALPQRIVKICLTVSSLQKEVRAPAAYQTNVVPVMRRRAVRQPKALVAQLQLHGRALIGSLSSLH